MPPLELLTCHDIATRRGACQCPPVPLRPVIFLSLLCTACASTRPADAPPLTADAANGQAIVTSIATPFYALFKATGCVLSAIIVVPSAAALAMTDRARRRPPPRRAGGPL